MAKQNSARTVVQRWKEKSDMSYKEQFNGKCPYTDEPCSDFECSRCRVEHEERMAMNELDEGEEREVH